MAKYNFDVAVAAAPQTGEGAGEFDATLDAVTTSLSGDPDGTDDGLVLGDASTGIGNSGLTITAGRESREKPIVAGSVGSRPISDLLDTGIPSLSFAFPWCGNRGQTTGTPVDGDFAPLRGVEAILSMRADPRSRRSGDGLPESRSYPSSSARAQPESLRKSATW